MDGLAPVALIFAIIGGCFHWFFSALLSKPKTTYVEELERARSSAFSDGRAQGYREGDRAGYRRGFQQGVNAVVRSNARHAVRNQRLMQGEGLVPEPELPELPDLPEMPQKPTRFDRIIHDK